MHHLISRNNIESNAAFQRMLDKTCVLTQKFGMQEVIKNRLTHSYEVATSAKIIASAVSTKHFDVDYKKSIFNVCLLHDIGHPPFGHEGASILNKRFKDLGLEEGFSDNNNNFKVIEKNEIEITDYELASLIKYPSKLYKSQEKKYLKLLDSAINDDIDFFEDYITINKKPTRTIACEIMDEADRNTYTCADLADCYSMQLANSSDLVDLQNTANFKNKDVKDLLAIAITVVDLKDTKLIKKVFSEIKLLINTNYKIADDLMLETVDKDIEFFRDSLDKISYNSYIRSDYTDRKSKQEKKHLELYIDYVLENDFYASDFYSQEIAKAKTKQAKLTLLRDMIADTTDNFVKKFCLEKILGG